MVDVNEIEKRVDRAVTATISMDADMGGIKFSSYLDMMEVAKTMATCRAAIPSWMRGSIGDCLAIWQMAARWGLDPFFVASKTYLMEGKSGTRIGFESQLIHAIIERLAPLKGRLRHEIIGEGNDRCCRVWGTFKGEDAPHRFTSETLGKRVKDIGVSQQGNFRGSPLWLTKPEVQLFYDASRDWARMNCPDVLAGAYTIDELPDMEPVDVTPASLSLTERLRAAKDAGAKANRGFDPAHIENEVRNGSTVIDSSVNSDDAKTETANERDNKPDDDGRSDSVGLGKGDADDKAGGADVGAGASQAGEAAAGSVAQGEDQSEIFPPDRKPQAQKRKRK